MFRLFKYLKPYVISLILIFALLFAQAMTDLALPSYMSDIVNIGIQQNGVSDSMPTSIRTSELAKIELLLSDDVASQVSGIYQTLDKAQLSSADYEGYVKSYPLLATENVSVLRQDAVVSEELQSAFSKALAVKAAVASGLTGTGTGSMPAGVSLFDMLATMSSEQRQAVLSQINSKMAEFSDSMLSTYTASAINAEYEAIGIDLSRIQRDFMFRTGGMMVLLALIGAACSVIVGLFASRVAAGVSRTLRRDVFTRVENFTSTEFDKFSTASLITRTTNDIQQLQMTMVMLLRILLYAPILGIGGVIKVTRTDSSMAWIIAVAVGFLLTLMISMFIVATPKFKMIQKLVDRLNLVTREILSGLMVIRAFNTQPWQEKKFDGANRDITRIGLFINRLMAVMMPSMMLLMNGVSLLIIWVGAHQVDAGNMQVGNVMAFMSYTMQIIMSFLMLSMVFIMVPRASVSGQRIAEVLAVEPIIVDKTVPEKFPQKAAGRIEFRDVGFQYPGADDPVLCNISFTAEPGQTTAFIGSTGCGKSTLVNLIPRFYDVSQGKIMVDGIDIREVTQHDLRERIGYVPQKGILFSGNIHSNIAYGKPDASADEIEAAATVAQAMDFIAASDQQFETPIAQGGANVSGGQKQRLSIARALVKRPDIYIFDDTFSALDYKTDAALRQALHRTTGDSTVLIVAQRIGTILHADQIIVLDEGVIVGIGKHQDLLANCPVYQKIASSQLSEEELAL